MISASRRSSGSCCTASRMRSRSCAALHQRLGRVDVRQRPDVVDRRLRPAGAVAVVVGRQVVGDADEPRPQRPPLGLLLGAPEVAVGLQEGLLREVLGIVMVPHPVVRVGVHVAQVVAIQRGERVVELGLVEVLACPVGGRHAAWRLPSMAGQAAVALGRSAAGRGAVRRCGPRPGRRRAAQQPPLLQHVRPDARPSPWPRAAARPAAPAGTSAGARCGCGRGAGGSASRGGRPPSRSRPRGTTGAPVSSARRPTPRLGQPGGPGRVRVPSGKISTTSPRARIALRGAEHVLVAGAAVDGEGAERAQHPAHEPGGGRAPAWPRSRSAGG